VDALGERRRLIPQVSLWLGRSLWRVLRDPGIAREAMATVRLRRVCIRLSATPVGRDLRAYFADATHHGVPIHRLAQPVLVLPERYDDYLRGHHRQAVRTNLHRAEERGIRCELLDPASAVATWVELSAPKGYSQAEIDGWFRDWATVEHFVARGPDGRPLAVAALTVDREVAVLKGAVAAGHDARWKLHAHLVEQLCRGGVSYLFVKTPPTSVLGTRCLSPNLRYYQHLLGYTSANVRVARSPRHPRLRRARAVTAQEQGRSTPRSAGTRARLLGSLGWRRG
jgi:hypothetical protein